MKRILILSLAMAAIVVAFFSSCLTERQFDEALLVGKWQSGTLYEVYEANHNGYTWNAAEDVDESEAQAFTWTLKSATLTHIHIMEMTDEGSIPKTYTVTELTSSTLSYEDEYGNSKTFRKVN